MIQAGEIADPADLVGILLQLGGHGACAGFGAVDPLFPQFKDAGWGWRDGSGSVEQRIQRIVIEHEISGNPQGQRFIQGHFREFDDFRIHGVTGLVPRNTI